MGKIEVGEYIRTIDGYIRKIDNINTDKRKITIYGEYILDIPYKNSKSVAKKKIIKHSPNIIDLIEIGDYVNGSLVEKTYLEGMKHYIKLENRDKTKVFENRIYNEDIKSIVTHEQFKNAEYCVNND